MYVEEGDASDSLSTYLKEVEGYRLQTTTPADEDYETRGVNVEVTRSCFQSQ